ncbi:MAG: MBL fold metallo-hydrolase [Pseudomonadales bacterium]|nr:MBL fold metallo-hydrolase [Candidatus Woesebacteria bacterium]MCB9802014.1 MBL fold metallo-hydrolase [Pseudomonadales bacterium]
MTLSYHGHSTFKIRGSRGTVVTDPYDSSIGLSLPGLSADIVTSSHDHADHNAVERIGNTTRRDAPFIIKKPGEYEVGGISVFGISVYHDDVKGAERGTNTIYTIFIDDVRICHLGDLGHELSAQQLDAIGRVDVLLCPVGGVYTIDPQTAVKVIHSLEPGIVIPMHYKTAKHNPATFSELADIPEFLKAYGSEVEPVTKLDLSPSNIPEETELVVLTESFKD